MDIAMNDFEYERRFFCRALPLELDDGEPMLIVQSYYVHDGITRCECGYRHAGCASI